VDHQGRQEEGIVTLAGFPRVRRGTIAPMVAALFALSGPATPSMVPLPKRSGAWKFLFHGVRSARTRPALRPRAGLPGKNPQWNLWQWASPICANRHGWEGALGIFVSKISLFPSPFSSIEQHLGDAEKPHDDGHKPHTVPEGLNPVGQRGGGPQDGILFWPSASQD